MRATAFSSGGGCFVQEFSTERTACSFSRLSGFINRISLRQPIKVQPLLFCERLYERRVRIRQIEPSEMGEFSSDHSVDEAVSKARRFLRDLLSSFSIIVTSASLTQGYRSRLPIAIRPAWSFL
jgi:hypothetical protein